MAEVTLDRWHSLPSAGVQTTRQMKRVVCVGGNLAVQKQKEKNAITQQRNSKAFPYSIRIIIVCFYGGRRIMRKALTTANKHKRNQNGFDTPRGRQLWKQRLLGRYWRGMGLGGCFNPKRSAISILQPFDAVKGGGEASTVL